MRVLSASDFKAEICAFRVPVTEDVQEAVKKIVQQVKERGDAAVVELEARFGFRPRWLEVPPEAIEEAYRTVPERALHALRVAICRVKEFHQRLPIPASTDVSLDGVQIGFRVRPLNRVGIYVPGGRATYPSTVVMTAVPARVAGVRELIMATPPGPDGKPSPLALVAASECGVDRVFCCGGAQAIAAMAFGTETVPRVDKIVGPGNVYVTAAKKHLYGLVDIDSLAGPSEIMIAVDPCVDEKVIEWVACDLMAQAEHDNHAVCVAITTQEQFARRLAAAAQCPGYVVVCPEGWERALELIEKFGPEHVELVGPGPEALAGRIQNAGAVFVGAYSPVALGDYVLGPSHVLPTGGSARAFCGLWTGSFLRTFSVMHVPQEAMGRVAEAAEIIAMVEGLNAHARSVRVRREQAG